MISVAMAEFVPRRFDTTSHRMFGPMNEGRGFANDQLLTVEEGADFDEKVGVPTMTQKQSWW